MEHIKKHLSLTWELDHTKGVAIATITNNIDITHSIKYVQGIMWDENNKVASLDKVQAIQWLLATFIE